jgi:hypothetical protein
MRPALGLAVLALALAGPAFAQDTGDGWDLETTPDGALVASVTYEGGVGLAVQCRAGELATVVLGLPAAAVGEVDGHQSRQLAAGFDPDALVDEGWRSAPDGTAAFAHQAGRQARKFKVGGTLTVRTIPGDSGAPSRRLDIPVPSNGAGVDRVLEACGVATADDRDRLPLVGRLLSAQDWRRTRSFEMPAPASAEGGGQLQVEVSCIFAPAGRVRDCRVESESHPGLGERLLRDAPNVRFGFDPEGAAAVEGRLIYMVVSGARVRMPPRRQARPTSSPSRR